MPKPRTPQRRHRHRHLDQFDLFALARSAACGEPDWKALPEAARQDVMTVLSGMMADHRRQRRRPAREAGHDD
jgi:hypothetical protein